MGLVKDVVIDYEDIFEKEEQEDDPVFKSFDRYTGMLGTGVCEPMMKRKQILLQLVSEESIIAVSRYVETEGRALYCAADKKELEGVVAKRKESSYLIGRRTKDWMKFKRIADEEFIAVGYIQKGPHTFSLLLAKYQKGMLVYQGYVTSSVTAADITELSIAEKSPFQTLPVGNGDTIWVEPERVCGCSICQTHRMHCVS